MAWLGMVLFSSRMRKIKFGIFAMGQRGRPKGSKNRKTLMLERSTKSAHQLYGQIGSGESIVDAMLSHHSYWNKRALDEQKRGRKADRDVIDNARKLSLLALEKAAPYVSARLSAVKIVENREAHEIISIEMKIGDAVQTVTHEIDGDGHSTVIDVTPNAGESDDSPDHLPDLQPGD